MKTPVDRLPFVCRSCLAVSQFGGRLQCSGGECERSFDCCLKPSCLIAAVVGFSWHCLFAHRFKGKAAFNLQLPRTDDEPPKKPAPDWLKVVK